MKTKYLPLLASAAVLFAACDDNEQPAFSDADAFVVFNSSTATVTEKPGEESVASVYVTLASLGGLEKTATVEVPDTNALNKDSNFEKAKKAVEGVNFRIISSKTFQFNDSVRTAEVKIAFIPDGVYTGDMKFKLVLKSDDVNVGHESECVVTLADYEHPLQSILGSYAASADSYFPGRGHFNWTVTISKDDDVSKVYVDGLDPYFAANNFMGHLEGAVNSAKTEITVAAKQEYGYQTATFEAFSEADPDDDNAKQLSEGESLKIAILDGGDKLVVENAFGIYMNGWYNLMYGNLELTKNK